MGAPEMTAAQPYAGEDDHVLVVVLAPDPPKRTACSDVFQAMQDAAGSGKAGGRVAVKRWRYGDISDKELDERNRRVQSTVAGLLALRHPNLLHYLGLFVLEDTMCIVSPWAAEGTVMDYIERTPAVNRRNILLQVSAALEYLHNADANKREIVHGDIHAGNVLVAADGHALLADFGLSTLIPDGDGGNARGKLLYIAPELHECQAPRSSKTDVFAFGVLIWEVFSGRPPFPGLSAVAAMLAICQRRRPARQEITRDDFTDDLWRLVNDCWAHAPSARPSMRHVRTTLEGQRLPGGIVSSLWNALLFGPHAMWNYTAGRWRR